MMTDGAFVSTSKEAKDIVAQKRSLASIKSDGWWYGAVVIANQPNQRSFSSTVGSMTYKKRFVVVEHARNFIRRCENLEFPFQTASMSQCNQCRAYASI